MDELGRSPAKVVWGKESRKRTRREANECGRDQWNVRNQIALQIVSRHDVAADSTE